MNSKTYSYLISYTFDGGAGSTYTTFKKKINSFDDIEEVRQQLETKSKIKNVAIMNYVLVCIRKESN